MWFSSKLTKLDRGTKAAIAKSAITWIDAHSPAATREDVFAPCLIWLCYNDHIAQEVFWVFRDKCSSLSRQGQPHPHLALLLSTMNLSAFDEMLQKGKRKPCFLIATESKLMDPVYRRGWITLSEVKKVVFDNFSMMLTRPFSDPESNILHRLDAKHKVVLLASDYSEHVEQNWKRLSTRGNRQLGRMPTVRHDHRDLLNWLAKFIKIEALPWPGTCNAAWAVKQYSTAPGCKDPSKPQHLLAVCHLGVLDAGVRRYCTWEDPQYMLSKDGYFPHPVHMAHRGMSSGVNVDNVENFKAGRLQSLFTTINYIFGAQFDFLPTLMFTHLPENLDEFLCMIYW